MAAESEQKRSLRRTGTPQCLFVNQQQRVIMDSNRALWQAAKLEMKGKLIVLDLTEATVCRGVCGGDGCAWGCRYGPDAVHS